MIAIAIAIGILPVLLFLAALLLWDSYKLLRLPALLLAIGAGAASGLLAWLVNDMLVDRGLVDPDILRRFVAPFIEEALKAVYIVYLLRARKIGFLIDAAIFGFAVGAGFSVVENLAYASLLPDAGIGVWIVRGLGTALMHGGSSALFAVLGRSRMDTGSGGVTALLPGFVAAALLHALYNHFLIAPVLSALLMVVILPLAMRFVLRKGERNLRGWLGVGFDTDQELLRALDEGILSETSAGRYIHSLLDRFPALIVFDMTCMLRLHLELSIHAKGTLLMREAGLDLPPDETLDWKFLELKQLEKNIGRAGMLAIQPCLSRSTADLWQLHMLRQA